MSKIINEDTLKNYIEVLRFLNSDHEDKITFPMIKIKLSDGAETSISEFSSDTNLSALKTVSKHLKFLSRNQSELPKTLRTLEKLFDTSYFDKICETENCDYLSIVIRPNCETVQFLLGYNRNRIITNFLFKLNKKLKLGIDFDNYFNYWDLYGYFSAKHGFETPDQFEKRTVKEWEEHNATNKNEINDSLTAEQILTKILKGE